MRFTEFKLSLVEQAGSLYTIGDSHAVAVAHAGGKDWVNLAIGGRSSTDSAMLANISKIPKGATVLVSQGANDTANAMRASMETKKPPKDPKAIASNVANVVSKVQAQGANVIFLLFPNGPGRGPGLAKYYGGDYQEDVRNAIKSAVSVPIIDINGKPLTDGVHATMSVYREVANQVRSKVKDVKQDAPKASTKPASQSTLTIDVPSGKVGPAVADVQKALIALGYSLPKHGVDGVRGPETINAVKKFQRDYKLAVDGDPGPETVGALNKLIASKGIKFEKSTQADVKSGRNADGDDPELQDTKNRIKDLAPSAAVALARSRAEKFLGREMSDREWDYLLRATFSEASPNTREQGYVMAVILNRARSGKYGGNDIVSVLTAKNQFQAVTGTAADGHRASKGFMQGPSGNSLNSILTAAASVLPDAPKDIYRFTAANPAAYGPGTNIGYLHQLKKAGGVQIGGTIFA